MRQAWSVLGGALAAALAVLTGSTPAHADPKDQEKPNYWLPALEITLGLGAATAWYAIDDRNVLDWDHPSFEQRLNGQAWRFDNNTLALNYVWHPLAGAGMYVLARGNRLGVGASFAYTLVGSTLWEYVVEFNEKVSINDMLVTPLAGIAVGEFFHKLAVLLSDVPASEQSPALAWTLGFSVNVHRRLEGARRPRARAELVRDLSLRYGLALTPLAEAGAQATHRIGFRGRLVSLPGYAGPRELRTWFGAADFAAFSLDLEAGRGGLGGRASAETWILGHHRQSGAQPSRVELRSTTALAVAYTYENTRSFGFRERQGFVSFPRAVSALTLKRGEFSLASALGAHPSFGSMNSFAYPEYRRRHPDARTKTVLEREGYFYGVGFGAQAEAELALGRLSLGGLFGLEHLVSLDGLDRTQERLTADPTLRETEMRFNLSGKLRTTPRGPSLGLVWEQRIRRSRMGVLEARKAGTRYSLELSLPL